MAFLVVLFVALALQQQMSNANFTEVKTNFSLLNDAAKKIKPRLVTAHKFYLDVRMNHSPKRPDAYEVVNRIYDYDDAYVTGFQLLKVNLDTNHHMILSSNHGTYFVWANRATGFTFPPDSGMLLRKGTKLTLTTHYLVPLNNDQSGFRLHLTRQKPKIIFKTGSIEAPSKSVHLPAGSMNAKVDHSCSVRGGPAALYAVMVHTHKHGTKVEFNKRTIKTGQHSHIHHGNPQNPQVFENINSVILEKGDRLNVRCTYDTSEENTPVVYGVGRNEMCGVYYYYIGRSFSCV